MADESKLPGVFVHLPDHGPLSAGARSVGEHAEGPLLVPHLRIVHYCTHHHSLSCSVLLLLEALSCK